MFTFLNKSKKYLYASLCLFIVVIVYEQFSHGVTSNLMRLSVLIPFVGGFMLSLLIRTLILPNKLEKTLWYMCLSSLTIGFFIYGVFEIYGSIESLVYLYFYFSAVTGFITIVSYIRRLIKKKVIL